jgi:hypothetical protein
MDAHELCKALHGECSMNRMVAWVNGKKQIIAKSTSGEWKLEPVGAAEAARLNAAKTVGVKTTEKPKPKTKYGRKAKNLGDESVEVEPPEGL